MPQISQIGTFVGQVFWLFVTFAVLYVVLWRAAMPRVSSILQERQTKIDEDLRKAEDFKKEADEVLATYEKAVADARAEAQALIREANDRVAAESAARQEALTERINADIEAAETRIAAARAEAVANIQTVAAEVAQAATSRLIGIDVASSDAEAAVANIMEEHA